MNWSNIALARWFRGRKRPKTLVHNTFLAYINGQWVRVSFATGGGGGTGRIVRTGAGGGHTKGFRPILVDGEVVWV